MNRKLSVITISITPFDETGQLDEAALRKHLRRLRDGGVSVFVGGSGSGEAYSLTPEENDRILAIAVEELKGKVEVYADGCEPRTTAEMVRFVRRVENCGADAVRIMPLEIGHSCIPTTPELDRYHSTVIESTANPIILTSHHSAGYVLPLELIEQLAKRFPSIVGVNYGGTDTTYLSSLIASMSERLVIHCAGCTNGLTTLALGGNGFMGNEGNVAPALAGSVITAFQAGDKDGVRASFGKLLALSKIIYRYGGYTLRGMKPLLNALGLPGGTLREPRVAINAADLADMLKAVRQLQIPELPESAPGIASR